MTLIEFLLARIAEEEAAAEVALDSPGAGAGGWSPQRILLECAIKRRLVEPWRYHSFDDPDAWSSGVWAPIHDYALRGLALPFADHPDYDEAWRP